MPRKIAISRKLLLSLLCAFVLLAVIGVVGSSPSPTRSSPAGSSPDPAPGAPVSTGTQR